MLHLLQKFTRGLGSDNLDYRLDASNPNNAKVLESNISLTELETIDHGRMFLPVLHSPKSKTMGGFLMSKMCVRQLCRVDLTHNIHEGIFFNS